MSENVFRYRMMSDRLFQLTRREIPRRAKMGLARAGAQLLFDAVTLEPKAPVDTTSLIGSASVFVEGEKTLDSPYGVPGTESRYEGNPPYTDYKATEGEVYFEPGKMFADVVFNAPYAAEQHELWPNKVEEGAGCHYISVKIGTYIGKYLDMIYDRINFGLEHAPDPNAKASR
jgi:hypothetical protein